MTTQTSKPSIVALIPARAGSKRVPGKNMKRLGGKPLIAWTIEAAKASGIFSDVVVSTDDVETGFLAGRLDALVINRPAWAATDDAADIGWVRHALEHCNDDAFAILRPTSPFRTANTIRRAWYLFQSYTLSGPNALRSIRAVEPVKQHPGKMWRLVEPQHGQMFTPFLASAIRECGHDDEWTPDLNGVPWHSCPTQSLPQYYVQNASLEIADVRHVTEHGRICDEYPIPFFTEGIEGFDINTPEDWARAEQIMADQQQPLHYLG